MNHEVPITKKIKWDLKLQCLRQVYMIIEMRKYLLKEL